MKCNVVKFYKLESCSILDGYRLGLDKKYHKIILDYLCDTFGEGDLICNTFYRRLGEWEIYTSEIVKQSIVVLNNYEKLQIFCKNFDIEYDEIIDNEQIFLDNVEKVIINYMFELKTFKTLNKMREEIAANLGISTKKIKLGKEYSGITIDHFDKMYHFNF